jgi:hypothetical protein
MPQTSSGLDALGFATYNNNPQAGVKVLQGRYTVTVGNPNIAPGSSSTPQMLSNVGRGDSIPVYQHLGESNQSSKSASAPYQMSNADAVKRAPHPCYSTGNTIQGQKPMPSPGTGPSFEKLAPKSMSTKSGPMGTDYKK